MIVLPDKAHCPAILIRLLFCEGEEALKYVADCKENSRAAELTEKESRVIDIIRNIEFGEVRVVITDGVPVRIEEIKKSIKL